MFTKNQKSIVSIVGFSLLQVLASCGNHKEKLGINIPLVKPLNPVTPARILPQKLPEVTVQHFARFGSPNSNLPSYEINVNPNMTIDYLCPKEMHNLNFLNMAGNENVILHKDCIKGIRIYDRDGKKAVALYLNGYDSLGYPPDWRVTKRKIVIEQAMIHNQPELKEFEEFELTKQGRKVELTSKELIEEFHNENYCNIAFHGEVYRIDKTQTSFWENLQDFIFLRDPVTFLITGKKLSLLDLTAEIIDNNYIPLEEQSDEPQLCSLASQKVRRGQGRRMDKQLQNRFGSDVISNSITINQKQPLTIKTYTVGNQKKMRIYWEDNFINYPQEWKNSTEDTTFDTMLEITTKSGHRLPTKYINPSSGRCFSGDELMILDGSNNLVESIHNKLSALCDVFVIPMVKKTVKLDGYTTSEIQAGKMVSLADLNLTVITDN